MDNYIDTKIIFEQYIATSPRKLIIFVVNRGAALTYGLGTYTASVCETVRDNGIFDFIGIILDAEARDVKFDYCYGLPFYIAPIIEKNRVVSFKSIVYYLASRLITEREIVFHFNLPVQLMFADIVKTMLRAKIIYTQHFMEWGIQLGADRDELLRRLEIRDSYISRKFSEEQKMMILSDIVIAVAKHSVETMTNYYHIPSSKIKLIPHAIEINSDEQHNILELREKYNLRETDRIILYVGRLDANKNVRSLIHAFSKIMHEDTYLWIVGEGHLNLFLNEAPTCDWRFVKFWGYRNREEIKELYSLAEIGIIPSNYEEFGYVAVEMMVNGLPVIVNHTSGLAELVEGFNDDIILSFDGNLSSLVHAIKVRLQHPVSIRDKEYMKKTIRDKYSQTSFKAKIMDVYLKI